MHRIANAFKNILTIMKSDLKNAARNVIAGIVLIGLSMTATSPNSFAKSSRI